MVCLYALEVTLHPLGLTLSLWPSGAVVYGAVVIVANIKLYNAYNNINVIGVVFVVLSIVLYFLIFLVETAKFLKIDSMMGIFDETMSHPITYMGLIFCIL